MAEKLPVEVITHIMKFLSVSDRKEAALVNKNWYEASTDPVLLRDTIFTYHANYSESKEWLPDLLKRKAPHVILDNIDSSVTTKSLILKSCSEITENLLSLSLKGSDLSEKTFVTLLSGCYNLRSLDVSCCNSLFMTGTLLSKQSDVESLAGVLGNVKEINLSSIRYISDATFNRLLGVCPNTQRIHLASNQIIFHSDVYYAKDHTEQRPGGNTAVLTFANILRYIQSNTAKIKALNFSRTAVHDEGLACLASIPGLQLEELQLVCCRDISDDGIIELSKKQPSLRLLDLTQCLDVTDASVGSLCQNVPNLTTLILGKCRRVTDISTARIQKLQRLEKLDISSCYTVTSRGLILGLCKNTLQNLSQLSLNCCSSVKDSFVAEACHNLPVLSNLDLSSCAITDKSVHYICKYMTQLKILRLAWCKDISDNGLLGIVDVNDPRLVKAETDGLCKCTRKKQAPVILNLPKKEEMSGAEPPDKAVVSTICESKLHVWVHVKEDWVPISNLKLLRVLDLTSCHRVTDASITKVMTFPELKSVHLSMCPGITDEALQVIGRNVPSLEELFLSQCTGLTDAGLAYVSRRLWRLSVLDISNCDAISNKTLEALFTYSKRLRQLDVSLCNNVTFDMVEMLENNMPHLRTVQKRLVGGSGYY